MQNKCHLIHLKLFIKDSRRILSSAACWSIIIKNFISVELQILDDKNSLLYCYFLKECVL